MSSARRRTRSGSRGCYKAGRKRTSWRPILWGLDLDRYIFRTSAGRVSPTTHLRSHYANDSAEGTPGVGTTSSYTRPAIPGPWPTSTRRALQTCVGAVSRTGSSEGSLDSSADPWIRLRAEHHRIERGHSPRCLDDRRARRLEDRALRRDSPRLPICRVVLGAWIHAAR